MKSNTFLLRFKRRILSRIALVRWILGLLMVLAIIAVGFWLRQPARDVGRGISQVVSDNLPRHAGRINFLMLGIGGGTHDGFDLTDTMIMASVNVDTGDTFLLSIPRDIWVDSLKSKINTAYHYGEERQPGGGGLILAKASVSEIISQPIDFAAVIDFSTFTKFIDTLGGIDVDVENTFDDYLYPIAGKENDLCGGDPEYLCRYEHLHFTAGLQHLDGPTALKYVRSRHSLDLAEGSDFARSRRQERVIAAVRTKLLSAEVIKQPKIYQNLKDLLLQSVKTDVSSDYYYNLLKLGLKMKSQTIRSAALMDPDQLYHPAVSSEYDNQWVLLPKPNLSASISSWLAP